MKTLLCPTWISYVPSRSSPAIPPRHIASQPARLPRDRALEPSLTDLTNKCLGLPFLRWLALGCVATAMPPTLEFDPPPLRVTPRCCHTTVASRTVPSRCWRVPLVASPLEDILDRLRSSALNTRNQGDKFERMMVQFFQEVQFATNYIVKRGKRIEKIPKDGEGRLVSLDPLTCELNRGYFTRRRAAMKELGVDVPEDAYAYSPDPAGREPWNPDTMTHRYRRYANKVGIRSSLKELRHYSATQLLAAGVDLNTVAGRLGHAEGSTTLKFYAQFSKPADQHAAAVIPSQLDGLARKNGSASSTASNCRRPVPTGLAPWPRSSVRKQGLTNTPLSCGLRNSPPRTEYSLQLRPTTYISLRIIA